MKKRKSATVTRAQIRKEIRKWKNSGIPVDPNATYEEWKTYFLNKRNR